MKRPKSKPGKRVSRLSKDAMIESRTRCSRDLAIELKKAEAARDEDARRVQGIVSAR
jgi:hypothetical protein